MIKLATHAEMKIVEQESVQNGQTLPQIRQSAAGILADVVESEFGYMAESGAIGLLGTNPKGEIALHALLLLAKENWSVTAYLLGNHAAGEADLGLLKEQGCTVIDGSKDKQFEQLRKSLEQHAVWIDAVAASDARPPLDKASSAVLGVIGEVYSSSPSVHHVVAIDSPSGIHVEEGIQAPEALSAELTVAMGAVNPGALNTPLYEKLGELHPEEIPALVNTKAYADIQSFMVDYEAVQQTLSAAMENTGKESPAPQALCLVGGSIPQPAGILLAARAALRAGAEAVTVALPSRLYEILAGHLPEASWLLLAHDLGSLSADGATLLHNKIKDYSCIYLGPGIGNEPSARDFLVRLLEPASRSGKRSIGFVKSVVESEASVPAYPPFVIDKDAFPVLEQINGWQHTLPTSILMLDMAQLKRLLDKEGIKPAGNRIEITRETAIRWKQTILLTDNPVLVASPDGRVAAVTGPACPARAGATYLLGGLTAGLCARGVDLFAAASAGAWIYQAAIRRVQGHSREAAGILASDIEAAIPNILQAL